MYESAEGLSYYGSRLGVGPLPISRNKENALPIVRAIITSKAEGYFSLVRVESRD